MRCTLLLLPTLLIACEGGGIDLELPKPWPGSGEDGSGGDDTGAGGSSPGGGPEGFVGSPCTTDTECDYDGGICLTDAEGFPAGMCSLECDRLCPDAAAAAVTFCAEVADLPTDAWGSVDDGACLSRCDFGLFPSTGCRPDYGCAITTRPDGGEDDDNYACLPERDPELTACHDALAARDIPFEPSLRPTESPDGYASLTCEIADPVWLLGSVEGADLFDPQGFPTPRVLTSCEAALALADTAADLRPDDVVGIRHWGSYSCRTIAGTGRLSQHAFADAFDLTGFELRDGSLVTLVDHWEHGTDTPGTGEAALLYDAAWRWYEQRIWNVVLTPNYNAAHDDHFHVDLTPGEDYIGFTDGRYIGPALYVD